MGQRNDARIFAAEWKDCGNEKSDSQNFWRALLSKVFYIKEPEKFINFEQPVSFNRHTHFIDAFIPSTRVLIEQKNCGEDLSKKFRQSDGIYLTPFEQALRYAENMEVHERPRWIVTCNFSEFHIYYVQNFFFYAEISPPVIVKLEDLSDDFQRLKFLVDPDDTTILEDVNISKEALKIIAGVRDSFLKLYKRQLLPPSHDFIYKFCVRLVFCFYADDAVLFATKKYFADYLNHLRGNAQIDAIQNIFDVLNLPANSNLRGNFDVALQSLPYVNGGLFEEKISFPNFERENLTPIESALIANKNFHWEKINPTIFGSLFESALNPHERRQGGMHYTSPENIHKVIKPLFLYDLAAELKSIKHHRTKNRLQKLLDFQDYLASLVFLDPACGSGNFLTATYTAIRNLENEVIRELDKLKYPFPDKNPVKVSIKNFFGIEINDYAVAIARLAMVISEHQALHTTEKILGREFTFLPLDKEYHGNIICANALQIDWADIVPKDKLSYIIGNPPFVGKSFQTPEQKADMQKIFVGVKGYGNLDYVTSWYKKAADFIQGTKIECTFVSTNSITQGEQVALIWKNLPVKINFARRTFKWQSESETMAAVHCVIIGFAVKSRKKKFIYDGDKEMEVQNINAYLLDAPQVFIESRATPICNVPEIVYGNKPTDGGYVIGKNPVDGKEIFDGQNLIFEAVKYNKFTAAEKNFIRPFIGAEEFLHNITRYCLWLVGVSLSEIEKMPHIKKRVEGVKKFRLKSKKAATRKDAERPTEFQEIRQPKTNYLLVPRHSSENRRYIPIGFINPDIIAGDSVHIIPNATLYHFGVLTSSVHMAWTRVVCGRLKSDYRYSKDIVYNNFIWCEPDAAQKSRIEETAQKILDVRAEFEGKTLAYLYNESTMPEKLRAAHLANDAAVMAAYGFEESMSEAEIVAALMKKYQELTSAE